MLQKITKKIAFFLLEKEMLLEDDVEWCIYLLKKWIFSSSILIILFLEGLVWATPIEILFYIISVLVLRRRSGGDHASTPLRCMVLSMLIEMLCFIMIMKIKNYFWFHVLSLCFGGLVLWFVIPTNQKEKTSEMKANKRILRKILTLEGLVLIPVVIFLKADRVVMEKLCYWNMGILTTASCVVISKWEK